MKKDKKPIDKAALETIKQVKQEQVKTQQVIKK
jgi:hypothetical protein